MTATLTGMGELVDIQRDEFGREVRVNVNVNVKTCQCFTKPRKCTGESMYRVGQNNLPKFLRWITKKTIPDKKFYFLGF